MTRKQTLIVFFFLCASYLGFGQLNIAATSTNYTINFDATVTGVSNGAFAGTGFQPTPAVGQLDSDAWAVTGLSDGNLAFGGIQTTATTDYTRGNTMTAGVTTGGIYSYGSSDIKLMIQPTGTDWAPGTLTLRIQNNTGAIITDFNIAYDLYLNNDQARSNSFNFSYSSDNVTYTSVGALDYISIAPADALGMALIGTKSITISGLSIADGAYFYIRWSGADVAGSGNRDEFALDNIVVNGSSNPVPEINVEGNLGAYPDISNGDSTPSGTDNTLFASQFIGASQSKSYRINNEGTANLTISGILIGGDSGDFTVTVSPSIAIAPSTFSLLEITFSPLASGLRTAVVYILNNDSDESLFSFTIQGTGNCVSSSLSISPSIGPTGSTVTVTGTNFGALTTVTVSGIPATHTLISSTVIEVVVPNNATTGNIEVVNDLGCTSSILFNVIEKTVGGCEGGSDLSDLIISEVTDATTGGLTYIEIYNGTGGNVQLNNYSLEVYSNGSATASGTVNLGPGNLSNNSTYVVAIGISGAPDTSNTCSIIGGNGELANKTSGIGGINKKDNEHDAIRLLTSSGTVVVDEFGVFQDNTWMDATTITGDRGFNFRRLNNASPLPNPGGFSLTDWNIIDWAGSGQASCSTNDYSNIGFYDFSTSSPPLIITQPVTSSSTCDLTATLTVVASEGNLGGNGLAYQWYYAAPGDSDWTAVPNSSPYSGETTNVLEISNTLTLNGYQYYCQIRENDATCYKASNAVKLDVYSTTWNGSTWSSGAPTLGTIATLNGNYTTNSSTGSFSACSLIVNAGSTLNIADGYYVEVDNYLTVNGNIIVQSKGAFVQNNDLGSVDGAILSDKTKIVVNKNTAAPAYHWYEYTYWSSPVVGETIADGLYESSTNRRFLFNAENYLDHCAETNNNNICDDNGGAGLQDGIDDDNNDWQWVSGSTVMQPGVGYASTNDSTIFGSTPGCPGPFCSIEYTFEGPFNNGEIAVPVYRNDLELNDSGLNFIGNPYPSAISADDFFDLNAFDVSLNPTGTLEGVIYLWSQNTLPSATANGNQNLNFSDFDYAIINAGTGQTAGGDGLIPTRFVPSGQGFFVNYSNSGAVVATNGTIITGEVIFNNTMRVKGTSDNSQFFRMSDGSSTKSKGDSNKLWVNLSSDIGVLNQILVGYVDGATNQFDGTYYDIPRNFGTKTALALYSFNFDDESKYTIQGKDINSLNLDEVIPLGFYTAITGATLFKLSIAQFQGDFFTTNTVYLKDNLMHKLHNLSESDYTFTSDVGEFKDRFEIVFQNETLSDLDAQLNTRKLTIIELNDGQVQFKTNSNLSISSVKIMDMTGRIIYQLKGSSSTEIYNLSKLSQSAYIAKVELSNGQTITKRTLKSR